jgi:hypothetical protein
MYLNIGCAAMTMHCTTHQRMLEAEIDNKRVVIPSTMSPSLPSMRVIVRSDRRLSLGNEKISTCIEPSTMGREWPAQAKQCRTELHSLRGGHKRRVGHSRAGAHRAGAPEASECSQLELLQPFGGELFFFRERPHFPQASYSVIL